TGWAYTDPWGATQDVIYNNLTPFKNQVFKVNLTEKVGDAIWYRGYLENGKKVWIQAYNVIQSITIYTKYNITLVEALNMQLKVSPQTDKEYNTFVSKSYINSKNEVTASTLNVRGGPGTDYWIVGQLKKGDRVTIIGEKDGWYQIEFTKNRQWVNASPSDVLYYLNPANFINDPIQRFQFLDLSKPSGASAETLNKFLKGKGVLEGKGAAFVQASQIHGINDVYLISHALLETGNGTSSLAKGIEVGKDKFGNLVLVTSENRSSLKEIKKTYNMFGIGAVDGNALQAGAFRAYKEGWFSPEQAIIGGAAFIGNEYIKAGQNTLYKMRWNPKHMETKGTAGHQYASDIGWASKQISSIYNIYQKLELYNLILDIPVYK
ncbi:glucosaminidase domain-containing protein, partial [Aeribacillus pallidus]|nr:glucosaminidase domain-containing protein [Aeribacillus pallidus]